MVMCHLFLPILPIHFMRRRICRLCDEAVCVPSRCPITDEDAPDPLESLT